MPEQLRVLVLDDSSFARELVSEGLREAGFVVEAVASLTEFDAALEHRPPHVILMDVQMPEVNGDNVCRLLKHLHETKSIPVVLYSTLPDDELARLAERAGADAYVSKSHGLAGIIARIDELTQEIVF